MMTTAQAANTLKLKEDTLRRWACGLRKGPLKPAGRFGGCLMWDAARVQALARERAAKAAAAWKSSGPHGVADRRAADHPQEELR